MNRLTDNFIADDAVYQPSFQKPNISDLRSTLCTLTRIMYVNVAVAGDSFGGSGTVFEEAWSNYSNFPLCTKLTLHCHLRRVKMDLYHFFHWALTSEPHVLAIYGPVKAQACLIQLPKTGAESVLQNTSINHTQNFSRRSQDQKEPNSCTQKALTLLASCM